MISRYLGAGPRRCADQGSVALAQGDAEAGEKVFNKCKACHVADEPQTGSGRTWSACSAVRPASKASSTRTP